MQVCICSDNVYIYPGTIFDSITNGHILAVFLSTVHFVEYGLNGELNG